MTSRTSDPSTSKDAGRLATTPAKLRASHALILNVFAAYGDMNDKDLLDRVHDVERNLGKKKLMSPSGVRSRRSELSKPNMDALDAIAREHAFSTMMSPSTRFADLSPELQKAAQVKLRHEGIKSKLWDTGKREEVDGRDNIVWGLAK